LQAVRAHRNILVIGGTGSGKTTLVNAIINEMVIQDPTERVFIIEDTGEIQCAAENYVQYHTSIDVIHDGAAENHPAYAPRPNPGRRGARGRSP
jgi:Flp pilus assembly CpaF family ATPase